MAILAIALLGASALLSLHFIYRFGRNIKACRKSGIPFVVLPFNPHSIIAGILTPLWGPVLALTPRRFRGSWHIFMNPDLLWDELYAPFREFGSDTILTCSPTNTMLHTCSADVVSQVVDRRGDFPKPTHYYSVIDIYGKSSISVEGDLWRKHRKVTAGPFNERNNHVVWSESIYQAQELLRHVLPKRSEGSADLHDIEALTSKTALAIISKAGYGIRLSWHSSVNVSAPTSEDDPSKNSIFGSNWVRGKLNGHKMSYEEALLSVSNDVFWLFVFPRSILQYFPWNSARRASQAYLDWGQYMREMIFAAREQQGQQQGRQSLGSDVLSALARSTRDTQTFVEDETTKSGKTGLEGFSEDEVMGNLFLLIMAGHETTAGVLHMTLILLAMHVDAQRSMQKQIDMVFGARNPSEWDYKEDFPTAFDGMIGAVLAEVLRWMPPVSGVPKWAMKEQTLKVNGKTCFVPADTIITMHAPAAHRNPNQWPYGRPSERYDLEKPRENPDNDLGEFCPERWLICKDQDRLVKSNLPVSSAAGLPPGLYHPPRGAYFPFSEGHRACLGRRFSQVELVGIVAVIFQRYSVELAVDEWASDAVVNAMDEEQRRTVWGKARDSAAHKLRHSMKFLVTNRLTNAHIPIRVVPRGQERFDAGKW